GWIGGQLPYWLGSKQTALIAACGIMGLSLWPAVRLRFLSAPNRERVSYPRGPFIGRFLAAVALWNLALGAVNPVFNAYFARHVGMTVDRIGLVFSGSQLLQATAVLLAPVVLRKTGLVKGTAAMQLAAGMMLASLALGPGAFAAALSYAGYMAFQS